MALALARLLVRYANWRLRNDSTENWNPWLVRRKIVP
jgi:hypothetical protein